VRNIGNTLMKSLLLLQIMVDATLFAVKESDPLGLGNLRE